MDAQIAKKTQDLASAEAMRDQTKMIMQPYVNWEQYLTPAPLSIAILGELVFISSKTDFSINKSPPLRGYKYIRHPDSFRACLMQVCNSGWWAFNEAHKNMDQIRLYTMTVPDFMKTTVNILFQGSDQVIKSQLPLQLDKIHRIANECLSLAKETKGRFDEVISTIHELLEVCTAAQMVYGQDKERILRELEENKLRKMSSEEAAKRSEKAMKSLENELREVRENYKAAMKAMPNGWEMLAMDFVGAITEGISGLFTGVISVLTAPVNQICNAAREASDTKKYIKREDSSVDDVDKINIYSKSAEILSYTEFIQKFVQGNEINWKELYDPENRAAVTDFPAAQLKRLRTNLEKFPECEPNREAKALCDDGIAICKELAQYAPAGKCAPGNTMTLIWRINNLVDSARRFDSKSKNFTRSPPIVPNPPMMLKQSQSQKSTPSQRAADNCRFRIEMSHAQLQQSRELYDKSMENMERNQKELNEILIKIKNCEVKDLDFKTILEILSQGLKAMAQMKEHWEKMVQFFQMISSIVNVYLTNSLNDFANTSDGMKQPSYSDKLFLKDKIYNEAFQATNVASLVHMISSTYTEVSSKYLMDRISSLGRLFSLDVNKPEFEHERQQFHANCKQAERAIQQLVLQNKEEFDRKTQARLEKIERELRPLLPAAAPEQIRSIEAAAKEGFTESEQAAFI